MIRMSDHFAQILHIDDDDAWTKVGRGSKQMFCSIFWLKAGDGIGYNSFWTKISRRCYFGPISPPGANILVNELKAIDYSMQCGACVCVCSCDRNRKIDSILFYTEVRPDVCPEKLSAPSPEL